VDGYFIGAAGYYEGGRQNAGDLEVSRRPSYLYRWGGAGWIFDPSFAVAEIRLQRDYLLGRGDWTQLPDVPFTETQRQQWREYRQKLRDFPATCDPANPVWPDPPIEIRRLN